MTININAVCHHSHVTLIMAVACAAGCSQYIDPNVPEPIRPFVEPETGREYLLYRPSSYDNQRAWPLIVVCAGGFPDSPNRRIRAWTQPAERYGFLVAAPTLEGNGASWLTGAGRQISRQREDEKRILAAVRHVRAGHNVSDDRIFIHGYAGGAAVALRTGLRHPDAFRAIGLAQPGFDDVCLADAETLIDPYQPVFVHYDMGDVITGRPGHRCVEWLRTRMVNPVDSPYGTVRPDDMQPAVEFFEDVVRKVPWIRIRAIATEGDNPLELRFKLRCTFKPTRWHWNFGDGQQSTEPEPVHTYAAPGDYVVAVTVNGSDGKPHTRATRLAVPEGTLTGAAPKPET